VELRADLSALCLKAGLKKLPTVLLVTDAQLVDETLLGPIHDFLAAGEIPGLFSDDEIDNVVSAVRNEVPNFINPFKLASYVKLTIYIYRLKLWV